MLRLEDVRFAYSHAADAPRFRFDMGVEPGTIAGVIGASGTGKSTLLDLIAGFQTPQAGRVVIDGEQVTGLPPAQRPVSILFQNHNLFEHLSALENVVLGLAPRRRPTAADKETAAAALARVGLAGFEDHPALNLSGGQAQRVALARTLARRSRVLLLDEPFSALDEDNRADLTPLVRAAVTEHGGAGVLVTHDLNDCERLADRILEIRDGQLHEVG